jgi:CRP-like cAMP-binding protein
LEFAQLEHAASANKLLGSLSAPDFALLQPGLSPVDLPVRRQLENRNRRIEHVYFLTRGLASLVISAGANHSIEVGIIGKEGMTGLSLLLDSDTAVHKTFIQSAGEGWRISTEDLRAALAQSPTLANGRYRLEERLARWLLMAHDRSEGDTVALTHEFLSVMLGVRRPGVTNALNLFERRGIIQARRGLIQIINRPALEEAANGCYGTPEAEYRRLFAG